MLLRVENVRVRYEGAEALHGVSLHVPEGALVSVIGANGAGKSTLLRTISGLKTPNAGEIWFLDRRIDQVPAHRIVNLGLAMAPEGRRLFPYMTVLENLKLGAYMRRDSAKKISGDLDVVFGYFPKLKERSRQKAGTLSGGEQQMVSISRALMARPKLLLMDEPSLGLAPIMVREIAKAIGNINRVGITVLLVEQNALIALDLAHKAYVLENGVVALEGNPLELTKNEDVKRAYLGG